MNMKVTGSRRIGASFFVLGCVFLAGNAMAQSEDKMFWSVTPYFWASNTKVDIRLDGTSVGGADVSFKDLLDQLDGAFQGHIETGKNNWSVFTDFTFIGTSDSEERTLITIDTKSKQSIIDAVAAFWPGGVGSTLNLFAGIRYTEFNDRYRFYGPNDTLLLERKNKNDYTDALLGLRYRIDLSQRWAILTRGDLSFGDSEGTWQLQALLAYTVGKRQLNRLVFGYQYKEAEFKDGDLKTSFTYNGPMAGFNFRF